MLRREEIHIRDPFILLDGDVYYMYGTVDDSGFSAYVSQDLQTFDGPYSVFKPAGDFWGGRDFWAPEVHAYEGRFYLFGSLNDNRGNRGSQIFVADNPLGPFEALAASTITPKDWVCLDATLYVDESGKPWTVFCREWVQTYDGEMYAMPLTADLKASVGEPVLLFKATDAKWVVRTDETDFPFPPEPQGFITDGPWLYRLPNGVLGMLWSSFCTDQYTIAAAYSRNGRVTGPWEQEEEPLLRTNGGHGMLFHDKNNRWVLSMHEPNTPGQERPVLYEVCEKEGRLAVKGK